MPVVNVNNRNQYALITGATSGFGYELAKLFAGDGYSLILVARSEDRLQEVATELKQQYSVEVTPISADLFRPEAAKEIYDEVQARGIVVNYLVNDAGQGEWGSSSILICNAVLILFS
ncbi:SDR family NAD(P)-dependent oxidoreductase [Chitinophaga pinensis]|uniref:SDR family NAD(P)-dependent oxidoreductase n=1 Tax=Chitinophaga pinensis TaxID=79329 RepID=UPI001C99E81F|nr:SDR family NAD(P)-dependent oxidoreductase [Chitinophaga pinensis]